MKKFMYLSISMLCLMVSALVGFHMNSRSANASIVDRKAGRVVVAGATEGNAFSILTVDGNIYWVTTSGFSFVRTIPVPTKDVAFYLGDDEGFVMKNGDVWKFDTTGGSWINLGPAPR